jgi:hypothetical protein
MNTWEKLGELMVAVSFAEGGGHKCARGVLKSIKKAELESKKNRESLKREECSDRDELGELMVAVTFAEAGDDKSAREVLKSISKAELKRRCARELLKKEECSKKVDHILDLLRRPAHALKG